MSLIRRSMMCNTQSGTIITYTTKDHNPVDFDASDFDGNVVSNTYNSDKDIGMIKFDKTINHIGNFSFFNKDTLTSINIPKCIKTIGSNAFAGCINLWRIYIPKNVTKIANNAIYFPTSGAGGRNGTIKFESSIPPKFVANINEENEMEDTPTFGRVHAIYVPTDSVDAYKSSTYWSNYANYIAGYDFN